MRVDVFTYHSAKNLEQYFYYLELGEELEERGRNNVFRKKLSELSDKQIALDAKFYDELKNREPEKWYKMKMNLKKINPKTNQL